MTIKILCDYNEYIDDLKIGKAVFNKLNQKENLCCELIFCDEEKIRELNAEYRAVDSVTDVLSFPSLDGIRGKILSKKDYPLEYDEEQKALFIGSIAICVKRAKEQALEYGHSEKREFTFLTVHALLHLMGYDHMEEEDRVEMRALEDEIMQEIGEER